MKLWSYRDKLPSVGNLHDAYRKVAQLESAAAQEERYRKARLIAEKQATGKKPAGWDRSLDHEEKKRAEDAGYQERVTRATEQKAKHAGSNGKAGSSGFEQIVEAILREEPKHADLELDDMRSNVRQGKVFGVLHEYIESFDGISRQLEATYNLMRYLKRVAIELQPKTQEVAP
jgi:hypothetical protein